jgi:hypothetical protein
MQADTCRSNGWFVIPIKPIAACRFPVTALFFYIKQRNRFHTSIYLLPATLTAYHFETLNWMTIISLLPEKHIRASCWWYYWRQGMKHKLENYWRKLHENASFDSKVIAVRTHGPSSIVPGLLMSKKKKKGRLILLLPHFRISPEYDYELVKTLDYSDSRNWSSSS